MQRSTPSPGQPASPPDNGTKFRFVEFLPVDAATEVKVPPEMLQKLVTNAPARGIPVKHPPMHRARSLDYAIIHSGECDMRLDDCDVHLKAGDVICSRRPTTARSMAARAVSFLVVLMDVKDP